MAGSSWMIRRRLVAPFAAAAGLACGASPAVAAPALRAKPALTPSFRAGIPDYTVRCTGHERVRFAAAPPPGVSMAVGPGHASTAPFHAKLKLAPGRSTRVRVKSHGRARTYSVRCLPHDFPRWHVDRPGKPQARWYLVTPSRNGPLPGYAIVFDRYGVPVWWMRGDPPPFDMELLPDGGLAWTRWVFSRAPSSYYEEHALDGRVVRTYNTVGSGSNPHELRVLPDGSSLMVAYVPRDGVDLSPWGGPQDATVLDGEVQELDPAGNLVWRWSTADHVALSESSHWLPKLVRERPVELSDGRGAYDIAHVNSIERAGNRVVVSLRHADAVYGIDRRTGSIDWKLGGTRTAQSLRIVGDPHAKGDFGGQHDARLTDRGTVTLFDNGTLRHRPPRALELRIDRAAGTARVLHAIAFAKAHRSTCCGSARRLPGGHWVVSWGNNPFVGELTASGRPVFTLRFGGALVSYRAYPVMAGGLSRAALRAGMDRMAGQ